MIALEVQLAAIVVVGLALVGMLSWLAGAWPADQTRAPSAPRVERHARLTARVPHRLPDPAGPLVVVEHQQERSMLQVHAHHPPAWRRQCLVVDLTVQPAGLAGGTERGPSHSVGVCECPSSAGSMDGNGTNANCSANLSRPADAAR